MKRLQSLMATQTIAWTLLFFAGVLEVVWLVALRHAEGFARPGYGALSIAVAWLSFFLLAQALRAIPAGTAYAIWTGVGAAGGAIAGIFLFGESRDAIRLLFIALIVVGVIGVKVTD